VKITISKENYLKAIAEAEAEGETVIAATLARWLDVSAPAVTMAVRRLKRDGLVTTGPHGQVKLSAEGHRIATRILIRHHLIERMLTEVFGMEWYKVHEEAEQLEHAVSEEFERKLMEKLGVGETCPHGNRLGLDSAAERRQAGLMPLSELPPATSARVECVYERDRQLLEYLDALGIRPGAVLALIARHVDETVSVDVAGRAVQLGRMAADKVWMMPHQGGGRA